MVLKIEDGDLRRQLAQHTLAIRVPGRSLSRSETRISGVTSIVAWRDFAKPPGRDPGSALALQPTSSGNARGGDGAENPRGPLAAAFAGHKLSMCVPGRSILRSEIRRSGVTSIVAWRDFAKPPGRDPGSALALQPTSSGNARPQALPIAMPTANTTSPPSTTSNAARQNLVSM